MTCCDVNGLNRVFSGFPVRFEQLLFRWRGPAGHARSFASALPDVKGSKVLDIGGGLGGLGHALLDLGASRVQLVELSQEYLQGARRLAMQTGRSERFEFMHADAARSPAIEEADVVVLDRAVCCYPEAAELLARAASLSRRTLAFTMPRDTASVRLFVNLVNGVTRLLRHPYRVFMHDPELLQRAATSSGHRQVERRRIATWELRVFERPSLIQP